MIQALKRSFTTVPLVWVLLVLALSLRMYRVANEPLDWHAWRQADTASVTREFVTSDAKLLVPEYHDLSNIPSGMANPGGYRMVEFPIINWILAIIISITPLTAADVPVVSRVAAALFSSATVALLFLFVRRLSGEKLAYASAFIFATLPFSVYYGRVILPEPFLLFFLMLSLYTFQRWLDTTKHTSSLSALPWFFVSSSSIALALLLKPFAAFFGLVYLAVLYQSHRVKALRLWPWLIGFGLVAAAPLLGWRWWVAQYPAGIPANEWLFNGNGIRLRPAWFRWLGYERFTKLILGFTGMLFLAVSIFRKSKNKIVYWSWWAGVAAYFIVIATGNVQHDYYQVLALPIISIGVAEGVLFSFDKLRKTIYPHLQKNRGSLRSNATISEVMSGAVVIGLLCCMYLLSFLQVRGYFNTNHTEYVIAGAVVAARTPVDAKVIAPAFGDTQFLYQTNRRGWPLGTSISDKIEQGATHYISTSYDDEARALEEKYFVIEKTEDYILIDLTIQRHQIEEQS